MDKTELQRTAARILVEEKRLVCMWATGCGKSGVALQFLKANPGKECLILVPEQNNIENWQKEFEKFDVPMDNVEIACYASFHKYKGRVFDLLVFDEVPHIDTEKRKAICETVRGKYVLALGAVISDEEMASLEKAYGLFYKSTIGLADAINMKLLPIPTVIVLHLQLDNKEFRHFYKGCRYTDKGMYDRLALKVQGAVDTYNSKSSEANKRYMLACGNERKKFLGKMKEDAITRICRALDEKNKRYICFCSSIDQTLRIGGEEHSFTSKSTKSMRHLERFNSGEINSLFVVGKLIEGQNLSNIDCGIIGQIGGTKRITVQEIGRVIRSENPVVYVPIFDYTKDDSFLYTLTTSIPDNYIKHYKF